MAVVENSKVAKTRPMLRLGGGGGGGGKLQTPSAWPTRRGAGFAGT